MRFALSVVLFAFPTPALAVATNTDSVQSAAAGTATTAEPQKAEETKICKRIAATESRVGAKKLCMTAKQWKEYSDSSDD